MTPAANFVPQVAFRVVTVDVERPRIHAVEAARVDRDRGRPVGSPTSGMAIADAAAAGAAAAGAAPGAPA